MEIEIEELEKAFLEIQMPRTPYALEALVVNTKYTDEQRYAQCVLELSVAYDNLRFAKLKVEQKTIEMEAIDRTTRLGEIDYEIKHIEQEQTTRAVLGALREFECLYGLWKAFPIRYNRQQLNEAQPLEYKLMLETHALMDKNATGRISVSNQEGLRQIGRMPFPELDYEREVEKRFLEEGDIKLSIVVPTEVKAEDGLPCLETLIMPQELQIRIENCYGMKVADAYNKLFQTAMDSKSDYILTIEDDTFPQDDALVKLLNLANANPNCAVGAWYPKKEEPRKGVHIILKDGKREFLDDDGSIHEVYTMAMGCSLYPISMFKDIPYPWFKTTDSLTQDSFFSQLARERGYKLLVDTSIKCRHIERITGKEYV